MAKRVICPKWSIVTKAVKSFAGNKTKNNPLRFGSDESLSIISTSTGSERQNESLNFTKLSEYQPTKLSKQPNLKTGS
jgi:hypothetical protein